MIVNLDTYESEYSEVLGWSKMTKYSAIRLHKALINKLNKMDLLTCNLTVRQGILKRLWELEDKIIDEFNDTITEEYLMAYFTDEKNRV